MYVSREEPTHCFSKLDVCITEGDCCHYDGKHYLEIYVFLLCRKLILVVHDFWLLPFV